MRLCGWIPDAPDARDWDFRDSKILAFRPRTGASSIDYRQYDTPRVQRGNSCVGHALAAACALTMAIHGTPIAFPSALFGYSGARLLDRPKQPLVDIGCRPRLAMTWARDRGMVAEERWPETAANLNAVPPLDAFSEGSCATVEAFYRIASGAGASAAILSALVRGYCPIFAMQVDDCYLQLGRGIYTGPSGPTLGGHMQVIVSYSATLKAFGVRNTWGSDWGEGGYAWIAEDFIDRGARDLWVVQASPEVF